ncbi:MAG: FAD-binding oxidoreductase [Pseudomonadota bacterium]
MNLLYSNDARGVHAPSWYAATAEPQPERPAFDGDVRADVVIVGAGYTGLSAALRLGQAGVDVRVIEAHRVGWGASGRNGGQLGTGQRVDQEDIESSLGAEKAKVLWDLAAQSTALVKDLIHEHGIDCHLREGIIYAAHRRRYLPHYRDEAAHMRDHYGFELEYLDGEAFSALVGSPAYFGGLVNRTAGHLHPLRYAQGLATAAEKAGAVIHEETEATAVTETGVATAKGTITADRVILACNGYLGGLVPEVAARVMPINNFIIATEPLEETTAKGLISNGMAVADSKFVINYFRLSHDNRLLFGGRESYGYTFPPDIKSFVRKAMVQIYPQMKDARIDYGWGGTLAITMNRLPYLARVNPRVLNASGYSGHGVAMATFSGRLAADAVLGEEAGFDAMASIPTLRFPGGAMLRSPLLVLAMLWYTLRDRL